MKVGNQPVVSFQLPTSNLVVASKNLRVQGWLFDVKHFLWRNT